MPAPDSVNFNNERTEQLQIQHKVERSSVRNENQKSKEVAAGVKSSCLAITPSGKKLSLNDRDRTRENGITSAQGHCDCGGGWIILFEIDRDGEGGSGKYPFL